MNTKSFAFLLLLFVFIQANRPVHAQTINDLAGNWKSEVSAAPSGYDTGMMEVAENSLFATFSGDPNRYSATIEKCTGDSLVFSIGALEARCFLRIESKTKMTGKAVWSDGESPMVLTKIENQETVAPEQK